MAVTRCICFRRTFSQIQDLCRKHGWTSAEEIAQATGCGTGCGGCRPYLDTMLRTGHTCFRVRQGGNEPEPCAPDPWDIT